VQSGRQRDHYSVAQDTLEHHAQPTHGRLSTNEYLGSWALDRARQPAQAIGLDAVAATSYETVASIMTMRNIPDRREAVLPSNGDPIVLVYSVAVLCGVGGVCPRCLQPVRVHRPPFREVVLAVARRIAAESQSPRDRGPKSTAQSNSTTKPDSNHRAALARGLRCADDSAARAGLADALAWLEAVETVGEEIPESYESKRHAWRLEIGADRSGGRG